MRFAVLLCACCVLLVRAAAAQANRAWPAEIELTGPVRSIVLSMGDLGRTIVEGELVAGETRRIEVPLPALNATSRFAPTIEIDAHGSSSGAVRFARWIDRASELDTLPPGLRARPRPPVDRGRAHPSVAALCVCAAALVLCASALRRPRVLVAIGASCAVVVCALPPEPDATSITRVTVYEIAGSSPRSLRVDAEHGGLDRGVDARAAAVEVLPAGSPIEWRVRLSDGSTRASSARARFFRLEVVDASERRITLDENEWGDLAEVWTRIDGEWSAHGAWNRGAALAPAQTSRAAAPGWLATGLPQGVDVLLARSRDEDAYVRATF